MESLSNQIGLDGVMNITYLNRFKIGIWNIGIIEENIDSILAGSKPIYIKWMKHSYIDRFFADPFLVNHDSRSYFILVEEFNYFKNKGVISLLEICKRTMELRKRETLIEEDYHLSYPFYSKGVITPESYRTGFTSAYEMNKGRIEKKELIIHKGLIDPTMLFYEGKEWIFATDAEDPLSGLKVFFKSRTGEWKEHAMKPVKKDIETSRPGGHFFTIENHLYRPTQDSKKRYGHQINIMRVDKLDEQEYSESHVSTVSSDRNLPFSMGLHTFNVEEGFIIVDGYFERASMLVRPMSQLYLRIRKVLGRSNENS